MESVSVQVISPGVFACKLSVQVVKPGGGLVVWSRGLAKAPANDRLTDRWGKPLIRKLKKYEWIEGALLDGSVIHLICDNVNAVDHADLINLFDRYMPRMVVEINIVDRMLGTYLNEIRYPRFV